MNRDQSPFRYLGWHALDVARGPLVLYLVVSAMLSFISWKMAQAMPVVPTPDVFQAQTADATLTLAVLLATAGIISADRHNGWYRAWFSKPIAPWWYYLQRWLLGLGAVLLAPVFLGIGQVIVLKSGTGITADLLGTIALGYLLIGSTALLLAHVTQREWLLVFVLAAAQRGLAGLVKLGVELPSYAEPVFKALPPFHLIAPEEPMLTGQPLLHVAAYGLAMLVAALVLVEKRALGSGGRA
ncbi:MAG TPA: hypothetical protein VFN90_10285 [Gemmatimonadales bacterium]|nr:hypothetical protein [Gemmatimonadales bacterium]